MHYKVSPSFLTAAYGEAAPAAFEVSALDVPSVDLHNTGFRPNDVNAA